jgi:hypothetical protein
VHIRLLRGFYLSPTDVNTKVTGNQGKFEFQNGNALISEVRPSGPALIGAVKRTAGGGAYSARLLYGRLARVMQRERCLSRLW